MGCEYCKDELVMMQKEVGNNGILHWGIGKPLTKELIECCETSLIVNIDRGYLRLSNPEDNGCLDHGERIKINYCPICGDKVG